MTLYELEAKVSSFKIREELRLAIQDTAEDIAELNRGQLFLGLRSDGSSMDDYSAYYADFKTKLSHPIASITDRRTLYLSGQWWRSIRVDVGSETYEITNDDSKTADILAREGEDVLGLSTDSKSEYVINYLQPALGRRIENAIGLQLV